ncbi:unnamed protein product [Symbiodinium sp. CCMP2456]|nr:unnamed protein product [Symbiodinium sp. CCMP2456]
MFLVENGYFGCTETISFEKLLVIAFRDFKAFQCHSGQKCSQTKFVPRFVWKPETHGAHMGHKGHNGKIIAYWLGDCMQKAVERSMAPGREVCKWLHETNNWPNDERLELIAATMQTLCAWFREVEKHGRYLTAEAADAIYGHGMKYLRYHLILCKISMRMNKLHWHIRPKMHAFHHQMKDAQAQRLNPRHHHTFREEDAMRWLKGVAQRCDKKDLERSIAKYSRYRLLSMHRRMFHLNRAARLRNR